MIIPFVRVTEALILMFFYYLKNKSLMLKRDIISIKHNYNNDHSVDIVLISLWLLLILSFYYRQYHCLHWNNQSPPSLPRFHRKNVYKCKYSRAESEICILLHHGLLIWKGIIHRDDYILHLHFSPLRRMFFPISTWPPSTPISVVPLKPLAHFHLSIFLPPRISISLSIFFRRLDPWPRQRVTRPLTARGRGHDLAPGSLVVSAPEWRAPRTDLGLLCSGAYATSGPDSVIAWLHALALWRRIAFGWGFAVHMTGQCYGIDIQMAQEQKKE